MTEQTTPTPSPEPSPVRESFSGDADGLRAAADEILKKRGENEAVDGPGNQAEDRPGVKPDEAISLKAGADELLKYRDEKKAQLQKFENAVYGTETADDTDGIQSAADLFHRLHWHDGYYLRHMAGTNFRFRCR